MSNPLRLPPIGHFFDPLLSRRIVGVLHETATDTQSRVEHLRRPTIGFIYGDLVRHRMMGLAEELGESTLLLDAGKPPVIYKVGRLRFIHYSVHIRGTTYVTNGGKRLVGEYLDALNQGRLFESGDGPLSRLDGPLAVLATELLVTAAGGVRTVVLNHAFVGYPAALSSPGAITAWQEDRFVLTAPSVSEVMPEKHERLEEVPTRSGPVISEEQEADRPSRG